MVQGLRKSVLPVLTGLPFYLTLLGAQEQCVVRSIPICVSSQEKGVSDLNPASVRAEVRGKVQQIKAVLRASVPYRTVLLLDTSGSIIQEPIERATVLNLAKDFAEAAPKSLNLAVVTFASHIVKESGFTRDRAILRQKLAEIGVTQWDHIKEFRRSATIDAVLEAASLLMPAQPGDSILLITDGEDNASTHNDLQLTYALSVAGIRLFAGVLDTRNSRFPVREENREWVRRTVAATGGDLITCFPRERPVLGLRNFGKMMTDFYRMDVNVCNVGDRMVRWKLSISAAETPNIKKQKFRLKYPSTLVGSSAKPL